MKGYKYVIDADYCYYTRVGSEKRVNIKTWSNNYPDTEQYRSHKFLSYSSSWLGNQTSTLSVLFLNLDLITLKTRTRDPLFKWSCQHLEFFHLDFLLNVFLFFFVEWLMLPSPDGSINRCQRTFASSIVLQMRRPPLRWEFMERKRQGRLKKKSRNAKAKTLPLNAVGAAPFSSSKNLR